MKTAAPVCHTCYVMLAYTLDYEPHQLLPIFLSSLSRSDLTILFGTFLYFVVTIVFIFVLTTVFLSRINKIGLLHGAVVSVHIVT